MEKKDIKSKTIFLNLIDLVINLFAGIGFILICNLHFIIPFFPVLFLFDFCFWFGHPLFLRYMLKKKWFECTKKLYLKIKYILLPWLIMELIVLLYYHKATLFIIKTVMENSD